jgi:hypothetical protein
VERLRVAQPDRPDRPDREERQAPGAPAELVRPVVGHQEVAQAVRLVAVPVARLAAGPAGVPREEAVRPLAPRLRVAKAMEG